MTETAGFLNNINNAVLHPKHLWQEVFDQHFGKSFLYFFLLFFFAFIPDIPQTLNSIIRGSSSVLAGVLSYFFLLFVMFVILFIGYLIYAAFFYITSYILLNKANFIEVFKILIYSFTLPFIIVFAYNTINTLLYIIMGQALSMDSSAGTFLNAIYFIILLFSFFYSLYVQYTGLTHITDKVIWKKLVIIIVSIGLSLFLLFALSLGIWLIQQLIQL